MISLCLIFGGLGGLIPGAPLILSATLVMLGILGSLYSLARSNTKAKQVDYMLEGHGNAYTKAFEAELYKTGSCKNAVAILTKALEIDPNDKDAMVMLSMTRKTSTQMMITAACIAGGRSSKSLPP